MSGLTDRYVYEALSHAPAGRRQEVDRELRSAINDVIAAKRESGMDEQTAERAALEELGDPRLLVEQFAPRTNALIGPGWYPHWKVTVTKVTPTAAVVVGTLVAAISILRTDAGPTEGITKGLISGVSSGLEMAMQVVFWLTVVYAILERRSPAPKSTDRGGRTAWSVAELPLTSMKPQIGLGALMSDLVALTAFGVIAWGLAGPVRLTTSGFGTDVTEVAILNRHIGWG